MENRAIIPPANALLPGAGFQVERLLAPRDAIAAYLARVPLAPLGVEEVALDAAAGRTLARAVVADGDIPDAPRSAMDGFALDASATPGTFSIAGEVMMGHVGTGRVASGAALRIPTGGVVPDGCDAVVPIEHVTIDGDRIVVEKKIEAGDNVNERAADMRAGETVLAPGARLRAPQIGVLATLGITPVPVYRRPLLAVLSSGDELIAPDRRPQPGQIRDSNRYAIAASLRAMGADVLHLPIVRDEAAAFEAALRDALLRADGVVLTGGSSVGQRDRTPEAVAALGPPGVVVHGLKLRPGKPTLLGAAGAKPILGLPGNPTSALMMLEAVAAPLIAAMVGSAPPPASIEATLDAPLSGREGWTWFIPIALRDEPGAPMAHPLGLRSFSVSLTARADGYVILEADRWFYEAGERVTIHRFLGG